MVRYNSCSLCSKIINLELIIEENELSRIFIENEGRPNRNYFGLKNNLFYNFFCNCFKDFFIITEAKFVNLKNIANTCINLFASFTEQFKNDNISILIAWKEFDAATILINFYLINDEILLFWILIIHTYKDNENMESLSGLIPRVRENLTVPFHFAIWSFITEI